MLALHLKEPTFQAFRSHMTGMRSDIGSEGSVLVFSGVCGTNELADKSSWKPWNFVRRRHSHDRVKVFPERSLLAIAS